MRALHHHDLFYQSIAQNTMMFKLMLNGALQIRIELIDRPTTAVPWSSSSSSALQNIGVSKVVGRVRMYGSHFVCMSSRLCPRPSTTPNSCAHASSHIIHNINPTQPLCNPRVRHASRPNRAGRGDVRVDSVSARGSVKRVYPSYRFQP